jgi:hypothetical protein
MIDNTYRFIYDAEPSEQDLAELMHEVAQEARKKADTAMASYRGRIRDEVASLQLQYFQAKK